MQSINDKMTHFGLDFWWKCPHFVTMRLFLKNSCTFCTSNFYNKFTIISSDNIYHRQIVICNLKVYCYTYHHAINIPCLNWNLKKSIKIWIKISVIYWYSFPLTFAKHATLKTSVMFWKLFFLCSLRFSIDQ